MIEMQNVTVYKCDYCDYTDTNPNRMKAHESKCLSEQLKTTKNKDTQEIYNILDTDIINIKIKEFLEKYNLPVSTDIKYFSIIIGNSFLPSLLIDKSIRGIFDLNKFKLHNVLSNQRYSKNYLDKTTQSDAIQVIDKNIILKETEIGILLDRRKDITLESVKEYIKEIHD